MAFAKRFPVSRTFLTDAASICSSAPSLSELDSELEQLEQEQATSFLAQETASTVLNIAQESPSENQLTLNTDKPSAGGSSDNLPDSASDRDSLLMPPPWKANARPTTASLGLFKSIEEHMAVKPAEEKEDEPEESGELDLTGIDDEEIDMVSKLLRLHTFFLTKKKTKL